MNAEIIISKPQWEEFQILLCSSTVAVLIKASAANFLGSLVNASPIIQPHCGLATLRAYLKQPSPLNGVNQGKLVVALGCRVPNEHFSPLDSGGTEHEARLDGHQLGALRGEEERGGALGPRR